MSEPDFCTHTHNTNHSSDIRKKLSERKTQDGLKAAQVLVTEESKGNSVRILKCFQIVVDFHRDEEQGEKSINIIKDELWKITGLAGEEMSNVQYALEYLQGLELKKIKTPGLRAVPTMMTRRGRREIDSCSEWVTKNRDPFLRRIRREEYEYCN